MDEQTQEPLPPPDSFANTSMNILGIFISIYMVEKNYQSNLIVAMLKLSNNRTRAQINE